MKARNRWRRYPPLAILLWVVPPVLAAFMFLAIAVLPSLIGTVQVTAERSKPPRNDPVEVSPTDPADELAATPEPEQVAEAPAPATARRELQPDEDACGAVRSLELNATRHPRFEECRRPIRYRHGRFTITLRPARVGDVNGTRVDVRQPGSPRLRLPLLPPEWISVGVGQLDRSGTRYVILSAFSGGFHCCTNVYVVVPDGPNRGAYPIASFEAGTAVDYTPLPSDIDGDGTTDFVGRDTRFFYQFTGYTSTETPPPWIFNIRNGRLVDVSAEPRYRQLFEQSARELRPICLTTSSYSGLDRACPQYLAAAARIGRFAEAWREIWSVHPVEIPPGGCGFRHGDDELCLDLPTRLLHFLRTRGYLTEQDVRTAAPLIRFASFSGWTATEESKAVGGNFTVSMDP